jgi:hypothetical protein
VDEPNKYPKTRVEKFYDGLNNYKTKKPLEDMTVEGMTVEEFWQHGDRDYWEFEYGKPLVSKHVREWYFLACVCELNFIETNIARDICNILDFDLNVDLAELHTIYSLQMLYITMMTICCI